MGKAIAGARMSIALWLIHVCVFPPWFWKAPTNLVATEVLKGSSSAQAVGTLSGFNAEGLEQLSFWCQHSTVNN